MKCSDLTNELALYADGGLDEAAALKVSSHLNECPLCRQRASDHLSIRSDLLRLQRPEIPASVLLELKMAVRTERQARFLPFTADVRQWIEMRLMPYSVGVVASLVIGITFLTALMSGRLLEGGTDLSNRGDTLVASSRDPFLGSNYMSVSPMEIASSRMAFSHESPSVNPQGAVVALAKSLVRGNMKDEEVVVVADVFGDGLAQISEVVESPKDGRAVSELQRAFRADSGSAPFVPAVLENRPENMRIVLKLFGSIDVQGSAPSSRRSRN